MRGGGRGEGGDVLVGADDGGDEERGGDPVLGDLVVDLGGDVLPQARHHLLLERRQRVHHRLHPHRHLPHLSPRLAASPSSSVWMLSSGSDQTQGWGGWWVASGSFVPRLRVRYIGQLRLGPEPIWGVRARRFGRSVNNGAGPVRKKKKKKKNQRETTDHRVLRALPGN